jgi:hypothetical protein
MPPATAGSSSTGRQRRPWQDTAEIRSQATSQAPGKPGLTELNPVARAPVPTGSLAWNSRIRIVPDRFMTEEAGPFADRLPVVRGAAHQSITTSAKPQESGGAHFGDEFTRLKPGPAPVCP